MSRLARLPIDPRLGRMIVEADRRGCAREVMVPRVIISGIPLGAEPDDLRRLLIAANHTRYPVFEDEAVLRDAAMRLDDLRFAHAHSLADRFPSISI